MAKGIRRTGWIGLLFVIAIFLLVRLIQGLSPFERAGSDRENTFKLYPDFGIELPEDYPIHGIDVSRYQKRINWGLVEQMQSSDVKLGFAFMKATEGSTINDAQFDRNWKKSKAAGVIRGAYHFFRADGDAAAQARKFISHVSLAPGDLPPVLDVETLHNIPVEEVQEKVALWLLLVEQHYKVRPIIYTNASFYNKYLHPRFNDYPLWVAHYFERKSPRVNRKWDFWQHSERGRVNGIDHYVDFNVYNGDSVNFRKLLVGAPAR